MMATTSARPWTAALRRLAWNHPEGWVLLLAGGAWASMVPHLLTTGEGGCHSSVQVSRELQLWMIMVVAMMVPVQVDAVRHVAFRSYRHRRHAAMALFLAGYLLPWLVLGLAVSVILAVAPAYGATLAFLGFLVAAAWALLPWRSAALVACHATRPLCPIGWRAHRDLLVHGVQLGAPCVAACGPLMAACAWSGHAAIPMLGGALLGWYERSAFRVQPRTVAVASLALGLAYASSQALPMGAP